MTGEPLREGYVRKGGRNDLGRWEHLDRPPPPAPFGRLKAELMLDAEVSTIPTDTALAAEARAVIGPLLNEIAAAMNKARAHGLTVGFRLELDQYGRHRPSPIDVTRPL